MRSSRSEAHRRVLSAAFAQQNNNVVGATMASFLIGTNQGLYFRMKLYGVHRSSSY